MWLTLKAADSTILKASYFAAAKPGRSLESHSGSLVRFHSRAIDATRHQVANSRSGLRHLFEVDTIVPQFYYRIQFEEDRLRAAEKECPWELELE